MTTMTEHQHESQKKNDPRQLQKQVLGLRFTERMTGYFSKGEKEDFDRGAEQGQKDGSSCELTLTIIFKDAEEFGKSDRSSEEDGHQATIIGSATAPALSPHPLTVRGDFRLLATDETEPGARLICYGMTLTAKGGEEYYGKGEKVIRSDSGLGIWSAVTTLNFTLHKGGKVWGKGILKVHFGDFLKQLATFRVTNANQLAAHLQATTDFGHYFVDTVYKTIRDDLTERLQQTYEIWVMSCYERLLNHVGSWKVVKLLRDSWGQSNHEPRLLRWPDGREVAGELVPFTVLASETEAKRGNKELELRLTRYRGGDNGPVILSPGFGMSSQMFVLDTIQPNLTEYLYDRGYDVWLLDYRASADLAASETQFTVDHIAIVDYPAAIETVLKETRKPKVQVVAHCVGSLAFFMAMLAETNKELPEKVRSAICCQVATHPDAGRTSEVKAGLYVASVVADLGVETVTARFDETSWSDRALDLLFQRYHSREELCSNPVCRRILFLYGETHKHDNLNHETHAAIEEMFGTANLRALKHLSLMLRKDYIVNAKGENVYLPNIGRLKDTPITLIHGAENRVLLPSGTETTYNLLCEKNGRYEKDGRERYSRYVIPGYAHLDCFIGMNAARDVFPLILAELEKHN
jgi:cholesterol oxidase